MEDREACDDLEQFATNLRALRAQSGSPSFREMARRSHHSSSTLAEAVQGRRLPSQSVVEAFVAACGSDPDIWIIRWKSLATTMALRQAQAPSSPEPSMAGQIIAAGVPVADHGAPTSGPPHGTRATAPPIHRWAGRRILQMLVVAVLAATAGLAFGRMPAGPAQATTRGGVRASPVALSPIVGVPHDGADPGDSGCGPDATTLTTSPLTIRQHPIGELQLKYSVRCQGGWARFVLGGHTSPVMVEVRVEAQDGRASAYAQTAKFNLPVYTDLLHPDGGCLRAIASVDQGQDVFTATTQCLLAPRPEPTRPGVQLKAVDPKP